MKTEELLTNFLTWIDESTTWKEDNDVPNHFIANEYLKSHLGSLPIEQEQEWRVVPDTKERSFMVTSQRLEDFVLDNTKKANLLCDVLNTKEKAVKDQAQEIERLKADIKRKGYRNFELQEDRDRLQERIKELEEACRTVVNGYEMDGMEQMDTRDHVSYKYCKKALESSPIEQPEQKEEYQDQDRYDVEARLKVKWANEKREREALEQQQPEEQKEEQKDIWNEMLDYCEEHYINDVRLLEYLMEHYSLTRKNP